MHVLNKDNLEYLHKNVNAHCDIFIFALYTRTDNVATYKTVRASRRVGSRGSVCTQASIALIGSGIFTVIYSFVVVYIALTGWYFLRKAHQ